jgi:hypothetical protein
MSKRKIEFITTPGEASFNINTTWNHHFGGEYEDHAEILGIFLQFGKTEVELTEHLSEKQLKSMQEQLLETRKNG